MKDIYSKEERNKILNMAMKQYECCGVSLELGDYFVVEEYPTMIFKIDNEWDKKLRLFYTIITEKSFHDDYCHELNWSTIPDECIKDIVNKMTYKSYNSIKTRCKYYTSIQKYINNNNKQEDIVYNVTKDMQKILSSNNCYTKEYRIKELILYWNLLCKIVYKQDNKEIIKDIKDLGYVCAIISK